MTSPNNQQPTLLCIGHRGAAGHAPENTLLSIETALTMGAPCVEIDVRYVHGELLVIHDHSLQRTTNGEGLLEDHDWHYLRALDAGQGQQLPTLDEVFALINGRMNLNIELKGVGAAEPVVAAIHALLRQPDTPWQHNQLMVSSFNHRELQVVRECDASILLGGLMYALPVDDARFAEALGAVAVNPALEMVDQRLVDDAHARGLKVCVYTVNKPGDLARMVALGVDGVFSDYPDRVLAAYQQPDVRAGWV